jgi:hypothetical protein
MGISNTKQGILREVARGVGTSAAIAEAMDKDQAYITSLLLELTKEGLLKRTAPVTHKGALVHELADDVHIRVDYAPCTGTLRVYDNDGDYDKRSKYILAVTVQWLSKDTAYLSAAHGRLTRQIAEEIKATLKRRGAKKLLAERDGKLEEEVL